MAYESTLRTLAFSMKGVRYFSSDGMSEELRRTLKDVVAEEEKAVNEDLKRFKDLLIKLRDGSVWSVMIWVEGMTVDDASENRRAIGIMERAGLVDVERKFTHRNAYLEVRLTDKGKELAEKLR